jgi:integrase
MPKYKFKRENKRIELSEINQMLDSTQDEELKAYLSIHYVLGARTSEVIALHLKSVHFTDELVEITILTKKREKFKVRCPTCKRISSLSDDRTFRLCKKCGNKWPISELEELELREAKTRPYKESRIITLNMNTPLLKNFIGFFLKRLLEHTDIIDSKKDTIPIFIHDRKYYWRAIKRLNPNLSSHSFRHNRTQRLADRGATALQIKSFTGHKNISSIQPYIENSKQLSASVKDMID